MSTIVVCGKGGVGKTTVSALLCRRLATLPDQRSLAVDADHAGGLGLALGVDPALTLQDVRERVVAELEARDASRRADLEQSMGYRLQETLCEHRGLAFLSLGRPEEQGCFCAVNSLLKKALAQLSSQFDLTLVDGEAGLEQLNREVVGHIDQLVIVCDRSVKSLRVAEAVQGLAQRLGRVAASGLIINRVADEAEARAVHARTRLPLLGWIPEDALVARFDAEARPFFELPDSPASSAVARAIPLADKK